MPGQTKTAPAKKRGSGWKTKNKTVELTCPSGETCLVRKPSLQGLLSAGVLQSMDQLTGIVTSEVIPSAQGETPNADRIADAVARDPKQMQSVFEMIDRVTCYVVIDPQVLPLPANLADRDEDAVYVDDVELEDKMYIMEHALSGVSEMAPFRPES